jgi:foldase protein PrsA
VVEPAEVDKRVDDLRTRLGGAEALSKALERQGLTAREMRADIERSIILRRILEKEVFDKVVISEDDIRKEYEKGKAKFTKPEQVIITDTVFFLDTEGKASFEKAKDILKRILEDKDKNPGNLVSDGTFIVYDTEIKKDKQGELYEEARKLSAGEVSGVIKTSDSLHIIKLKEYSPEKQFTLEQVKGFLREKLTSEARRKALAVWGAELRKGANIEIMETQGRK